MITQVFRFLVVGSLSVGLYVLMAWYLAEHHGFPRSVAIFVAFALATTFNYLCSYHWTFAREVPHRRAIIRYVIIVIAGLIYNELGVELMFTGGVPLLTAVVICAATWPIFSYVSQRHWVFGS
jgi:putative flippase GtrA